MSLSKPYVRYVPCMFDSCGQQFTRKSSLYTHIRNVHKENPEFGVHPSGVHICDSCDKAFTRKDNLCAHIRKVHKKMPDCRLSGQLRCPISGCDDKNMITHSKLRKHLLLSHAFHVEEEELSFSSEDDFLKWKTELERKETSSYIHSSGWRKLANKGRSTFLPCNRSGMFSSTSKGHRRLKSQGTNKIGATCSSGMHVTVSQDSATQVLFYKTHCGHARSNAHVSIGCKQRSTIPVRKTPGSVCVSNMLANATAEESEQNEATNLSESVTKTDSSRLSQKLEMEVCERVKMEVCERVEMEAFECVEKKAFERVEMEACERVEMEACERVEMEASEGAKERKRAGRGGTVCCVRGCRTNSIATGGVSLHRFPVNEQLRSHWLEQIGRGSSWQPAASARICGLHFNADGKKRYEERIPTLFPDASTTIKTRKKKTEPKANEVPPAVRILPVVTQVLGRPPRVLPVVSPAMVSPAVGSQVLGRPPRVLLLRLASNGLTPATKLVLPVQTMIPVGQATPAGKKTVICRLCLRRGGEMHSVFDPDCLSRLRDVLQLEVAVGDGYPGQLCRECKTKLNEAFAFRQTSRINFLKMQHTPHKCRYWSTLHRTEPVKPPACTPAPTQRPNPAGRPAGTKTELDAGETTCEFEHCDVDQLIDDAAGCLGPDNDYDALDVDVKPTRLRESGDLEVKTMDTSDSSGSQGGVTCKSVGRQSHVSNTDTSERQRRTREIVEHIQLSSEGSSATDPMSNKRVSNTNTSNKRVLNVRVLNKRVLYKHVLNKRLLNEHMPNKRVLNVSQPMLNKHVLNISQPMLNKHVLKEPMWNDPMLNDAMLNDPVPSEPALNKPASSEPLLRCSEARCGVECRSTTELQAHKLVEHRLITPLTSSIHRM